MDPMDFYTMEECIEEGEILEDVVEHIADDLQSDIEALNGRRFVARRYVDRPCEEAKQRLMDDYF